jgi:hypothetical protein
VSVDMSPEAIDARLRRVSQLRRLCLSLARAGAEAGQAKRPIDPSRAREQHGPYPDGTSKKSD